MGNSASSSGRHQDETVDGGQLAPQGIYTGPRDWNQAVVSQFICARRLAPFYRPLEEYEDSWDDDQILAARKELPAVGPEGHETVTRIEAPLSSYSSSAKSNHNKRPSSLKEPSRPEAALYRGAVECPICFLVRQPHFIGGLAYLFQISSITLQILITLDAVTRRYVQSALYRSNVSNLRPRILFPNPPHARIVCKTTSE
jgi:hypothetical protein